jgi:nucleotide-binding universal stress UspA family protein
MAERNAVTVAVDGSAASLAAVRWAAIEAKRRHTPLRLVHVCDLNEAYAWSMPGLPKHLIELSRPMVAQAVELARRTAPGLQVSDQVLVGPIVRNLLVVSETAGLLVLGRSGQGALAAHLVGSTTNRLAAHAHCPVVAVPANHARPADSTEPGRIVVGLADRPTQGAALDFAIAEAARHAVPLLVVRAWHGPVGIGVELVLREDEQLAQVHQLLASHLARCTPPVVTSAMVRAGTPTSVLNGLCRPGDLLVLGQHRHAAFVPPTLGKVIADCLHQAPCPIAVVPEPAVTADVQERPRVSEAAGLIAY